MSVALRTITRLQDADDINVNLGAGVDEYALVYDHDTGKFVLRAPAAGGLLATGATVGATSQAQEFTAGIVLPVTTTATSGVIYKGADRFIHNFQHPTGQTAAPDGFNTFVGVKAGNFTMGSTATTAVHASYNSGIGYQCLQANTTGYRNVASGYQALYSNTTGYDNVAVGIYALYTNTIGHRNLAIGYYTLPANTEGNENTAIGAFALQRNTTGLENLAIGSAALQANVIGSANIAVGKDALFSTTAGKNVGIGLQVLYFNSTGANNTAVGWQAGAYHANGSTPLADPENSVYIGYGVRGKDNSDSNSIVIGYSAIGLGANTTVIGNTSTTAATIYGAGAFPLVSAATNAVSNVLTLTHDTSDTAANGFGAGLLYQLESSTAAAQSAARIQALWYEATHATRKADLVGTAYDAGGEREGWRVRGNGSAAAIGFLGAAPIARIAHVADPAGGATVDAEARSAINSILATLEGFGFHATS